MSTTLYLRADRRRDLTNPNQSLVMRPYRGYLGAINPVTCTTTVSGNNIQFTNSAGVVAWYSMPIVTPVTIAGNITFNLWGFESLTTVNASFSAKLEQTDNTGTVLSTIVATTPCATEFGASTAVRTLTVTPTSTLMLPGQMLKLTVFAAAVGGTMAAGTASLNYNSQLTAVQGDSFVTLTETIDEASPLGWWWIKQWSFAATLTSASPKTISFPATGSVPVSPGNKLVLIATSDDAAGGAGCTITSTTITPTPFTRILKQTTQADTEIWFCDVVGTSSGGNSAAVADSGGTNFPCIQILEMEHLMPGSPVTSGGASGTTTTPTTASLTPTAAHQFMAGGSFPLSAVATPYAPTTANSQGMEAGVSNTANPTANADLVMGWIDTPNTSALTLAWLATSTGGWDTAAAIFAVAPALAELVQPPRIAA